MEELVTHLVQARTFLSWRLSQPLQVRSPFHPITEPRVFVFPKHLLHGDAQRVGIHSMRPGQHSNPCGSAHSHTNSRKAKPSPTAQRPTFQKAKHRHLYCWLLSIGLRTRRPARHSQHPCEPHSLRRENPNVLLWITAWKSPVFISLLINSSHFKLKKLEEREKAHLREKRAQWIL